MTSRARNLNKEISIMTDVVKEMIEGYGLDSYIIALDNEETPRYWSTFEAVEDNLHQRLVKGRKYLIADVKKDNNLWHLTNALHSVVDHKRCHMPLVGLDTTIGDEQPTTKVGKALEVLLYGKDALGKYIPLEDGDTIVIDSGLPGIGVIRYTVEISDPQQKFNPYGSENFEREHLIELPIEPLRLQFGHLDALGNQIEENKMGWFNFTTKRIPHAKEAEPAGQGGQ